MYPVLLADGRDAQEREVNVTLVIGTETPVGKTLYTGKGGPAAKWGYFGYQQHFDWIDVYIAVSAPNFDRILNSLRLASPPRLTLGFGPPGGFDRLTGPITPNETGDAYRWSSATAPTVTVESCEISYERPAIETAVPEFDEPSAAGRVWGIATCAIGNIAAVLIALALYSTASTKFEIATVSLLLLIYVFMLNSERAQTRVLAITELASLSRFHQLRALLSVPAEQAETQLMGRVRKNIDKPGPKYWIDVGGCAIIGLLAAYKLVMLLS
jgi:hypothetical protein